jgi:hypothetical protein
MNIVKFSMAIYVFLFSNVFVWALERKAIPRTKLCSDLAAVELVLKPVSGRVLEKGGRYTILWQGFNGKDRRLLYTPANLIDPVVAASVRWDGLKWVYSYEIHSLSSSVLDVNSFWLSDVLGTSVAKSPIDSGWRVSLRPGRKDDSYFLGDWKCFSGVRKFAIKPGAYVGGLVLISDGFPGVVSCYVSGYSQAINVEGGGELPEEVYSALRVLDGGRGGFVGLRGKTMGPVSFDFNDRIGFINRLSGMVDECCDSGWIIDVSVGDYIKKSLGSILDLVRKKNVKSAGHQIEQLCAYLQKELGVLLTSEAHAILSVNLKEFSKRI